MKRVIITLIAGILCVSLSACGLEAQPTKEVSSSTTGSKAAGSKATESEATQTTTAKENSTFGLNETAVFKELKFTATEIKEAKGTEYFKPDSGNVFVGVHFTVENVSDQEQTVSSILLFDGYVDDVKADYSFTAVCAFSNDQLDGTIAPGKKLTGWYALEVPKDWKTIELHVKSKWLSGSSAQFVFPHS